MAPRYGSNGAHITGREEAKEAAGSALSCLRRAIVARIAAIARESLARSTLAGGCSWGHVLVEPPVHLVVQVARGGVVVPLLRGRRRAARAEVGVAKLVVEVVGRQLVLELVRGEIISRWAKGLELRHLPLRRAELRLPNLLRNLHLRNILLHVVYARPDLHRAVLLHLGSVSHSVDHLRHRNAAEHSNDVRQPLDGVRAVVRDAAIGIFQIRDALARSQRRLSRGVGLKRRPAPASSSSHHHTSCSHCRRRRCAASAPSHRHIWGTAPGCHDRPRGAPRAALPPHRARAILWPEPLRPMGQTCLWCQWVGMLLAVTA